MKKKSTLKLLLSVFFILSFTVVSAVPVLTMSVRATGTGNTFYYYLTVTNAGTGGYATDKATNLVVTAVVPTGSSFVSANLGGVLNGNTITWKINNLAGSLAGGSSGKVTPTFAVTTNAAGGTAITLVAATTGVSCTEDATVKRPAADITKTVTAASAVIEISATGNDATAAANLVTNADGSKSTAAAFPYRSWVTAMALVRTNNTKFQTVKFRPGTYNDGQNDIQSTAAAVNLNASGKAFAGLVIDGQGSLLDGIGSTSNFFNISNESLISDITFKNIIFSSFNDVGSGNYNVASFSDVDGLVIDNCTFYSSQTRQPISINFTNLRPMFVTISNCVFSGNSRNTETSSSGALEVVGNGTQTAANGVTVNINNTFFSCNRRNSDGGALKLYGSSNDGRATTFNISNSIFKGNESSTLGSGGAAIYIGDASSNSTFSNLNIYKTDFIENVLTGSTSAGGISVFSGKQIVNINGGLFNRNGYNGAAGNKGGVLGTSAGAVVSINGINAINNSATSNGGVFLNASRTIVVLDSSYFSNNVGGVAGTNNVTFTNSTVLGGVVPPSVITKSQCNIYSNYFGVISGNVFDDKNGYKDSTVNGIGIGPNGNGAGSTVGFTDSLYAALIDSSTGFVIAYVSVASNGTYAFPGETIPTYLATQNHVNPIYWIVLSTSIPTIGNTLSASLPAGWVSTGENIGTGQGNDGNTNTILTGFNLMNLGTTVSNLNFAIDKKPVASNAASTQTNPGGSTSGYVYVQTVPVPVLTGSDFENGIYNGTGLGDTIIIQTIPANGVLYYNGVAVTAGQIINNYNPDSLRVDPNDGISVLNFTFSEVDAAGVASNPATVTISFLPPAPQSIVIQKNTLPNANQNFSFSTAGPVGSAFTTNPVLSLHDEFGGLQPLEVGAAAAGSGYLAFTKKDAPVNDVYTYTSAAAAWVHPAGNNAVRLDIETSGINWQINSANNIYRNGVLSGTAKDVGVGPDDGVYIVGTDDKLYKWSGSGSTYTALSGTPSGKRIDGGPSATAHYIGLDNHVYFYNGTTSIDKGLPGGQAAKDIGVANDGKAWVIAPNPANLSYDIIYYWNGTAWIADALAPTGTTMYNVTVGADAEPLVTLSFNGGRSYLLKRLSDGRWIEISAQTAGLNNTLIFYNQPVGTYTFTETVTAGYYLQDIIIFGSVGDTYSTSTGTTTLTVGSGEHTYVQYTNVPGIKPPPQTISTACGGTFVETFGTVAPNTVASLPAGQTSYTFNTNPMGKYQGNGTNDGQYDVVSSVFDATGYYYQWISGPGVNGAACSYTCDIHGGATKVASDTDHTANDTNGGMLLVNADFSAGVYYEKEYAGLVAGNSYQFSAWIGNIILSLATDATDPNVILRVVDPTTGQFLLELPTGDIPKTGSVLTWLEKKGSFIAPPSGMIKVYLINNKPGGQGNDLVLDDISLTATCQTISGTIYNDTNGMLDGLVNGTGTNTGSNLYAVLVDSSNKIVASVLLPSNGTYSFSNLFSGDYSVKITTLTPGLPGTTAPVADLTAGWFNTGDSLGYNNGAGTGFILTGNLDSIPVVVGTSNVTGVDFGVVQCNAGAGADQNICGTTIAILTGTNPAIGNWTAADVNPSGAALSSTTGGIATVTFTGASTGTYLFIYNTAGICADTMAINYTAKPAAGSDHTVCAGTTDTLTGSNPASGNWLAYSGNPIGATLSSTTAGEATVSLSNSATGNYQFIYDVNGCTDTMTIAVNALPVAPAVTPTQPTCTDSTGTITITGVSGETYSFDTGAYSATLVYSGLTAGSTHTVIAKNAAGCISAATVLTLDASPAKPDAPIVTPTQPTCTDSTGTITITGVSGETYSFDNSAYSATLVYSGLASGSAHTVYAKNAAGCISPVTNITLDAQPVTPDAGADQSVCGGSNATLTGTNDSNGSWTAAGTNPAGATLGTTVSGIATASFTNNASGTFNFIYSANGCTDTIAIFATVKPKVGPAQTLCAGSNTTLVGNNPTNGTWTEAVSNPTGATVGTTTAGSATLSFTPTANGNFQFIYTANGCSNTTNVTVNAKPNAGVDAQVNCAVLPGGSAEMNALGAGIWTAQPGNPGTANIVAPNSSSTTINNFTAPGTYYYIWTNELSCYDVAAVTVTEKPFAGVDQVLDCIQQFPGGSITLTANDSIGTWSAAASNPGTANIASPNDSATTVSNFTIPGMYQFIWDNGVCTDTVEVLVKKCLNISGNVFNDVNGLYGSPANTVDGIGTGSPAGSQLYANLIDSAGYIVATATVSSGGTYIFESILPGTYTISISVNEGTVGQLAPILLLPNNWVNTGENIGSGAGNDGNVNGISAAIILSNTDITNVNFGIEELPSPVENTDQVQFNPGGTIDVPVPEILFAGTDPSGGTIDSLLLPVFPLNATSITVNGTLYTIATFPPNGLVIPTDSLGAPTVTILVDPNGNGVVTVIIPYQVYDNAGQLSSNSENVFIPFTQPLGVNNLNFTATPQVNHVILTWKVSAEINVNQYEVEYSKNGINFSNIGNIAAANRNVYNLIHNSPVKGINFYRLKIIDNDGRYAYSVIRKVNFVKGADITVYPNPAINSLNVTVTPEITGKSAAIKIYAADGKLVYQYRSAALNQTETIDVSRLSRGKYILQVINSNSNISKPFEVIR